MNPAIKRTFSYWWLGVLFVLLLIIGVVAQRNDKRDQEVYPSAKFDDKKPLGGKGLQLLLQEQGFTVKQQTKKLQAMPKDAKVWILLNPFTDLSVDEGKVLLHWVNEGGTLIFANFTTGGGVWWNGYMQNGQDYVRNKLHITPTEFGGDFIRPKDSYYAKLDRVAIASSDYSAGVRDSYASSNTFTINSKNYKSLVNSGKKVRIALIKYGKGHVIVTADALMFTNYALAHGDTAVLASNLVRVGIPRGSNIYFDERQDTTAVITDLPHGLLYYLWQLPLRWALYQLALAGLLLWAFYGKRLGHPVPIPRQQPVTKASQFAVAMAGLYQKAQRPKVPIEVLGEEFRRFLIRRTGASSLDSAPQLANRCHEFTGLPREQVQKLLEKVQKPVHSDTEALRLAVEMEKIKTQLMQ